jgi:hypothetical protein
MKTVCKVCHSSDWTQGYFESYDKVISDYNKVFEYTQGLLDASYNDGLIDPENPIDETIEVMYYYIWHHDGRRWRMGASMMGPDWTHWGGAVDTLLDKLNTMENTISLARENKKLKDEISSLRTDVAATQVNPVLRYSGVIALVALIGYIIWGALSESKS